MFSLENNFHYLYIQFMDVNKGHHNFIYWSAYHHIYDWHILKTTESLATLDASWRFVAPPPNKPYFQTKFIKAPLRHYETLHI